MNLSLKEVTELWRENHETVKCPAPRDGQWRKMPTNARRGGGWALLELTDAQPKCNGNKFLYFLLYTYAANKSTLMMLKKPKSEKRQSQKNMIWKQNCCHGNISQVSLVTASVVSFNIHKYFKNEKRMMLPKEPISSSIWRAFCYSSCLIHCFTTVHKRGLTYILSLFKPLVHISENKLPSFLWIGTLESAEARINPEKVLFSVLCTLGNYVHFNFMTGA